MTNLDLAPPAKTVDGLLAVPIDIEKVDGRLRFDGATQTGEGDVTIDFIMGPQDGCPIFDLRQTVAEAWLDGAIFSPVLLSHHDFGGGPQAELRVIQSPLAAGSSHSLRVRYSLALPNASAAGSYQPHLQWSAGPRLFFNFGFTDLGPGRYLEAWIPANLIFDQYEVALEVEIVNSAIAHDLITNGNVTALGSNHWHVKWPATSTAFSPLLEIRAADTLSHLSGSVLLPLSGRTAIIETWKPVASNVDLPTQLNNINGFLAGNEDGVGVYAHADRFVAFINTGGMEYDGATTTSEGSLQHETFHSWWGRGLKPASQPDAWWDEAWTTYSTSGGLESQPFDFTDPAIMLCAQNPWSRITPANSYSDGTRFFEGLASLVGVGTLNNLMNEFYQRYRSRPATTAQLEAHLLARSGNASVVDAFHRFVYGFADPANADVWLKDAPAHAGTDYWGGAFWDSPDVWVRRYDDGATTHQDPEHGQDNWFYARVRNRSATAKTEHFALAFNVKSYAGVEFVYPDDFLPAIAAVADFNLGAGESRIVKARWPKEMIPPAGTHPCLLAALIARGDHPAPGVHVGEHNNLAQKNLTIVDLAPDEWIVIPFVIANVRHRLTPWCELALLRPPGLETMPTGLLYREEQLVASCCPTEQIQRTATDHWLDCGGRANSRSTKFAPWTSRHPESAWAERLAGAKMHPFNPGHVAWMRIQLPVGQQRLLGWRVQVPREAEPGSRLRLHLVRQTCTERNQRGGIALEIRVAKKRT